MSQIDQAFIKAYQQHAGGSDASPRSQPEATPAARTVPQDNHVRLDAAHQYGADGQTNGSAARSSPTGSRVPTPHLRVALGTAAWLSSASTPEKAAAGANASEARPASPAREAQQVESPETESRSGESVFHSRTSRKLTFSAPSIWSPTTRFGKRKGQSAFGQDTQSSAIPDGDAASDDTTSREGRKTEGRFISIEETLLRLEGVAAQHDACSRQDAGDEPHCEQEATLKLVGRTDAGQQPVDEPPAEELAEPEIETHAEADAQSNAEVNAQANAAQDVLVDAPLTEASTTDEEVAQRQASPTPTGAECGVGEPTNASNDTEGLSRDNHAESASIESEPIESEPTPPQPSPEESTANESPAATDPVEEPHPRESFQAVWEVDAFQWPDLIDQLQSAAPAEIATACGQIVGREPHAGKILAITGVDEQAGATTLTLTLARALAGQGCRVALVDADFDQHVLAERLGVRVQDGWEAALAGKMPLEEVCISSLGDGVTLVPLVESSDATATKASLSAAGLLKRLADEFDVVLIDAGAGSENVAAVATSAEGVLDMAVLLAVDQRRHDSTQAGDIIARLKHCALDTIQLAETFASGQGKAAVA